MMPREIPRVRCLGKDNSKFLFYPFYCGPGWLERFSVAGGFTSTHFPLPWGTGRGCVTQA